MLKQIIFIETFRFPGHIQEESDRIFHRLQVTYVHHPQFAHAIVIGQHHLLPRALYLSNIYPFGVTGSPYIVEMIIHAVTTFARLRFQVGQFTYIAPVVITEQQRYIVGHSHTFIIIILHFLIKRPYLRSFFSLLTGYLLYDFPLIFHDILQQGDIGIFAHRFIAVATHGKGDHRFPILAAFHPLLPEVAQHGTVRSVIPLSFSTTFPVLLSLSHRFMMGSTHHNSHLVGQRTVHRVIIVESTVPHGRPHKISFEAKHQFEHRFVELTIEPTKGSRRPAA